METRDTASKTSTRVKPSSEPCGACRKDIGANLDYFIRFPSGPQNLNLDFAHGRQWCGRHNPLPTIIRRAIRDLGSGLRSQRGRKKFSACFTEGEERPQFCLDQLFLREDCSSREFFGSHMEVEIPIAKSQ